MERLIQLCGDWWRAYMTRLRKRSIWAWLLVFVLAGSALLFAEGKWTDVVSPVFADVLKAILFVLKAPLWSGGIFFLGYLVVIAALAYRDVRPFRPDVAKLSTEVERLADSLKTTEAERDDWKRNHHERSWQHAYGTIEPELGDACATEARKEVEKLRPKLIELRGLFSVVMHRLVQYHRSQAGFPGSAVALFEEQIGEKFRASVELLGSANVDLRVALLTFDENYNAARKWLAIMSYGAFDELRMAGQPEYKQWYAADQAYFAVLRTLMEITEFGSTKRALVARRNLNEYPVEVPEPLAPGTRAVLTVIRPSDSAPSHSDGAAGPPSESAS